MICPLFHKESHPCRRPKHHAACQEVILAQPMSEGSSIPAVRAALGQLHFEVDGASEVAEGVEGGDEPKGSSMEVAMISISEHPCGRVDFLGLIPRYLQGEAEHQHATWVALLFTTLGPHELGALKSASHRQGCVLPIGPLHEGRRFGSRSRTAASAAAWQSVLNELKKTT
jgi:hypothetical protein